MPYKEIRADYSVTSTDTTMEGIRSFIEVENTESCTQEDIPALGDPFSVLYPKLIIRNIKEVPYHQNHSSVSSDKNMYKYVCSYSDAPVTENYDENYMATKFTGGTNVISLDLGPSGSEWFWAAETGDTEASGAILKRQVYFMEAKGTWSITYTIPQVEDLENISWAEFLTGGGDINYGILNSIGKINLLEVPITPAPSGETVTFKKGQLLFTNFDAVPGILNPGLHVWFVTMNFAYRVVNLSEDEEYSNIDYPWQYLINDKYEVGQWQYQLPVKLDAVIPPLPANDTYLYNFIDFNTSLNPLLV